MRCYSMHTRDLGCCGSVKVASSEARRCRRRRLDVDVQSDRIVLMVAIAELERQTTLYCSLYITFHPRRVRVTGSCIVFVYRVTRSCM